MTKKKKKSQKKKQEKESKENVVIEEKKEEWGDSVVSADIDDDPGKQVTQDNSDSFFIGIESDPTPEEEAIFQEKKSRKSIFLTRAMLEETYQKYPELRPSDTMVCQELGCSRYAILTDYFCLTHTRVDLTDYDIPWMCTAKSLRRGIRCTRIRMLNDTVCKFHDPAIIDNLAKVRRAGRQVAKHSKSIWKLNEIAKRALRSPDPKDWINLHEWGCATPRDLLRVMSETVNRVRMGTIPLSSAETIAGLVKKMLDILVIEKDMGLSPVIGNKNEEIKFDKDVARVRDNIVNFRERLKQHIEVREHRIHTFPEKEGTGGT